MSRYLKTATAAVYRNKKTYLVAGNYTFSVPFTSNEVKVMVFGGGGNACFTCINAAGSAYNCGFVLGAASGPGGGFSEKLYTGVAGSSACIVLGSATSNSSFCISGAGTVAATGGRLLGGNGTPWCHCYGIGSGGDINRCGSAGQTQCLCYAISCSAPNVCCYVTVGALIGGGSPGNSVNNGIVDTLSTGSQSTNCVIFQCTTGNYYGYGCCKCCSVRYWSQNAGFTRGYGCCPVSSATYYGFDWDVVGGDSCATSNFTLPSGCAFCSVPCNTDPAYCGCYCCASGPGGGCYGTPCCGGSMPGYIGDSCCYFIFTQRLLQCVCGSLGGQAGVTGSGGPGAAGGVGGGGGGVFLNPALPSGCAHWQAPCIVTPGSHPAGCCLATGGNGLVIVYY